MFLGIVIISIFCIIDDIKTIKPIVKLLGQVLAAIVVVAFGVRIDEITPAFLTTPELKEIFSIILTIGWIVGVTNAINLIDGLDGLSAGISVISAVSLLIIFVLNGSPLISILLITALAGALVGFLPFNFAPAKTFIRRYWFKLFRIFTFYYFDIRGGKNLYSSSYRITIISIGITDI